MERARPPIVSQLMATIALAVGAVVGAWRVRARGLFRRGDGSNGRGLSGSRVPRRPRLPFMPPRAAEAEPEESRPAI